jgi:hypothetical protein
MHKKHLITGTPTINNSKECADNYRINTRKNWHNRFDNSGVVRSEYERCNAILATLRLGSGQVKVISVPS